jgi:tetratricopeptide (TPR) repeat protein
METLKMIQKIAAITLLAIFSTAALHSQDYRALEKAFSESYRLESGGDYTGAVQKLQGVYNETSYELNLRLGWLSYMSGNFSQSSAYYEKAVNLKPFSLEARFGYVYPLSATGNWNAVKQQYMKMLEIDPMNSIVNYRLGLILYNSEDYPSALKYFEKVVNAYPFDYDGTIMYAWTNFKLGKLREAKILFSKALLISPGDASANEGLRLLD